MKTQVSIVIPVLNEAATIPVLARRLPAGVQAIAVDGGSTDGTLDALAAADIAAVKANKGRANQMNEGAMYATGDVLVFLHADTVLPGNFSTVMDRFFEGPFKWGRFDVRLSGSNPMLRLVEFMMNWRSRITGICTGDQAIFVRRSTFEAVGGFPALALMEDIALSKCLKKLGRPWCPKDRVVTSSRRWEQNGILKTILLMWQLRLRYFFGENPDQLVRRYYG